MLFAAQREVIERFLLLAKQIGARRVFVSTADGQRRCVF
jgi:hypothetical protein